MIAHEFKKPINSNHDSHINSVYLIDKLVANILESRVRHLDIHSMSNILIQNESLPFLKIKMTERKSISSCGFYQKSISFSKNHVNMPLVAIHEFAHYIDELFGAINLPAHHISFLSAYDYLINKNIFNNKKINIIGSVIEKINGEDGVRKIPYIKNYYQVFNLSKEEYESTLNKHKNLEKLSNSFENNISRTYGKHTDYEKTGFDLGDHYLNLIHLFDNERYIKVIVKKLGYEVQDNSNKKEFSAVFSPIFMMTRAHGDNLVRTHSHLYAYYNGVVLHEIKEDEIEKINHIINNDSSLSDFNGLYKVEQLNSDSIAVLFYYNHMTRQEINFVISQIKKSTKAAGFDFYQSKSFHDLNRTIKNNNWFSY